MRAVGVSGRARRHVFRSARSARDTPLAAKNPAPARTPPPPSQQALLVDLQHRQERLLRHPDPPDLLHPLLARFLLLQQLLLAGDVATVELCGDVLAQRLDRLPGKDAGT